MAGGDKKARRREREINAAVVLCGALHHFDKSHSELTTPADSTLKSDWLEQLQVRRNVNGPDVDNKSHTHTHAGRNRSHMDTLYEEYPARTPDQCTLTSCLTLCISLVWQLSLMVEENTTLNHLKIN